MRAAEANITERQNKIEMMFPRFLRIMFVIIYLCTIFISNPLSLLQNRETIISAGVVDYLSKNLNSVPISEIIFADKEDSQNFPDYEKLPIYTWTGAKKEESSFFSQTNFRPQNNTRNLPNSLQAQVAVYVPLNENNNNNLMLGRSRQVYNWGNTSIYVKRIKNFHYKNSSQNCDSGFVECSSELCVSESENCPITSIQFHDNETGSKQDPQISRAKNQPFLTNLEVSLLDKPCYALGATPQKPNAYPGLYIINGCGFYGEDDSAQILAEKSEVKFFYDNDLQWALQQIPSYRDTIQNDQVYLVTRQKIMLNSACHPQSTSIETSTFQGVLESFGSYGDVHLGIQINTILALFFTFFLKNKEFLTLLDSNCLISLFLTIWTVFGLGYNNHKLQKIDNYVPLVEGNCLGHVTYKQALVDFKSTVQQVSFSIDVYIILLLGATLALVTVYHYARRSSMFSLLPNDQRRAGSQVSNAEAHHPNFMVPLIERRSSVETTPRATQRQDRNSTRRETRTESTEMNVFNVNQEKKSSR